MSDWINDELPKHPEPTTKKYEDYNDEKLRSKHTGKYRTPLDLRRNHGDFIHEWTMRKLLFFVNQALDEIDHRLDANHEAIKHTEWHVKKNRIDIDLNRIDIDKNRADIIEIFKRLDNLDLSVDELKRDRDVLMDFKSEITQNLQKLDEKLALHLDEDKYTYTKTYKGDLNELKEDGIYYAAGYNEDSYYDNFDEDTPELDKSPVNFWHFPNFGSDEEPTTNYGYILVSSHGDLRVSQFYIGDVNGSQVFTRTHYEGNGWNDWTRLATGSEIEELKTLIDSKISDIDLSKYVKKVNKVSPDTNGNVDVKELKVSSMSISTDLNSFNYSGIHTFGTANYLNLPDGYTRGSGDYLIMQTGQYNTSPCIQIIADVSENDYYVRTGTNPATRTFTEWKKITNNTDLTNIVESLGYVKSVNSVNPNNKGNLEVYYLVPRDYDKNTVIQNYKSGIYYGGSINLTYDGTTTNESLVKAFDGNYLELKNITNNVKIFHFKNYSTNTTSYTNDVSLSYTITSKTWDFDRTHKQRLVNYSDDFNLPSTLLRGVECVTTSYILQKFNCNFNSNNFSSSILYQLTPVTQTSNLSIITTTNTLKDEKYILDTSTGTIYTREEYVSL